MTLAHQGSTTLYNPFVYRDMSIYQRSAKTGAATIVFLAYRRSITCRKIAEELQPFSSGTIHSFPTGAYIAPQSNITANHAFLKVISLPNSNPIFSGLTRTDGALRVGHRYKSRLYTRPLQN